MNTVKYWYLILYNRWNLNLVDSYYSLKLYVYFKWNQKHGPISDDMEDAVEIATNCGAYWLLNGAVV